MRYLIVWYARRANADPHILVAEDDPDTRELLEFVLRRAGFRVSLTDDCFQVLNVLAADHVDALLLDIQMPRMSGIEMCGVIRSFNRDIPIFFCSGAVLARLLLRLGRKAISQNRLTLRP